MAQLTFDTTNALTNKFWSKKAEMDTLQQLYFSQLVGKGSDAIIQVKNDLTKNAGDKMTFALRGLLSGQGKGEGGVLFGNEEKITYSPDSLIINELRHATEVPGDNGNINKQRVPYDLMNDGTTALSDWFAERKEVAVFNQLAGNTAQSDLLYTANNAVSAPSTGRIIRAGGAVSDQALGTTNLFDLTLIDVAVEMARTSRPRIRKANIPGFGMKYALFIHEYQATDLRRNTDAGNWFDIARMQGEGGKTGSGNNLFTTALGEYHDTVIFRSSFVPTGVNSSTGAAISTVRRAVFCGAQAGCIGYGKGYGNSSVSMAYEVKDYGHELGVGGHMVWGMKKSIYDSVDYGVITIPTYAAAHTS